MQKSAPLRLWFLGIFLGVTSCCGSPADQLAHQRADAASLTSLLAASRAKVAALDSEVALLGRLLAREQLLRAGQQPAAILMGHPYVEGVIESVSGRTCRIRVTDSAEHVDLISRMKEGLLAWSIYDHDGFKAEAIASGFDAVPNPALQGQVCSRFG